MHLLGRMSTGSSSQNQWPSCSLDFTSILVCYGWTCICFVVNNGDLFKVALHLFLNVKPHCILYREHQHHTNVWRRARSPNSINRSIPSWEWHVPSGRYDGSYCGVLTIKKKRCCFKGLCPRSAIFLTEAPGWCTLLCSGGGKMHLVFCFYDNITEISTYLRSSITTLAVLLT